MEKWGRGSSPGREVKSRGRTGVEWKLAPHYLQQLAHCLMIKCWSSICDESVCVFTYVYVCERERAYVCILTYAHCVCLIPLCTTYEISLFLCFTGKEILHCRSYVCLKIMIWRKFVVFPGEEAVSRRGWGAEKKSWALLLPASLNPCFKICDLCAMEGVNAHKAHNTHNTQPFLSPSLRVKGTNCELGIGKSIKQK